MSNHKHNVTVDLTGSKRAYLAALTATLLCSQVALFLGLADGILSLAAFLALHGAACFTTIILGASAARIDRCHIPVIALKISACTALAGPFGTICASTLLLPRTAIAGSENAEQLDEEKGHDAPESRQRDLRDRRLRISGTHTIRPLIDVMIDGKRADKFSALSVIYTRYDSAFASVLKHGLRDSDTSVRVLSATVMAKLHTRFTERIGVAQSLVMKQPEEAKGLRDLADAHLDYAESGILEASQVESEVRMAIDYLVAAGRLEPRPGELGTPLDAGRLYAALRGFSWNTAFSRTGS